VLLGNRGYIVKNNYPIWRDDRLLLEVEQAVKHFPCCHKYIFGGWLRHSQSKQLEVSGVPILTRQKRTLRDF
jgi:hypothetical protein